MTVRTGIALGGATLAGVPATRRLVEMSIEGGVDAVWFPQLAGGLDALTAIAAVGDLLAPAEVEVGTAVVPVQTRHPIVLASQVRTVQGAGAQHITLGLGVSHAVTMHGVYGMPFERPLATMRDYLVTLTALLRPDPTRSVEDPAGAERVLKGPDQPPVPIVIAALGPRMLALAATDAAGTITWMVGRRTLATYILPTLYAAAPERPHRVIVTVPACVTAEPPAARAVASAMFGHSADLPSYRAMLDREGVSDPVELTAIGSEDEVVAELAAYVEAGATEIAVMPFGSHEQVASTIRAAAALSSISARPAR